MSNETQSQSNTTFGLGMIERVIFSILTTLICCVFFCINIIMLFTLRSKRVFCETSRYILLFNLLLADTMQIVVSQLMFLLSVCRIILTYPFCGILVMSGVLLNPVSPLTLVVMSLERYVAVCYPLRHATIITVRNTVLAIIVVWAFCSLNVFIRVNLLLEFPFSAHESLQMKTFCNSRAMVLGKSSQDYEKAYTYFLFTSAGLTISYTYIHVIVTARSASTDKASVQKARKTLLLHLGQLGLSLSSTVHNPLLAAVAKIVTFKILSPLLSVFYVVLIILPRCLSALIYGLRDQTMRPILLFYLCFRMTVLSQPKLTISPM